MFKSILAVIILAVSVNAMASEATCVNNNTGKVSEYNQGVVTVHGFKDVSYKTTLNVVEWVDGVTAQDTMFTCNFN